MPPYTSDSVMVFYDWTWTREDGGRYTSDTEGNLVQLCERCAAGAGDNVEWAADANWDAACELCDASDMGEVL